MLPLCTCTGTILGVASEHRRDTQGAPELLVLPLSDALIGKLVAFGGLHGCLGPRGIRFLHACDGCSKGAVNHSVHLAVSVRA